ncbi:hypothetical protein BJ508DRAFT_411175, partial [Ascobolus immersus RN42]
MKGNCRPIKRISKDAPQKYSRPENQPASDVAGQHCKFPRPHHHPQYNPPRPPSASKTMVSLSSLNPFKHHTFSSSSNSAPLGPSPNASVTEAQAFLEENIRDWEGHDPDELGLLLLHQPSIRIADLDESSDEPHFDRTDGYLFEKCVLFCGGWKKEYQIQGWIMVKHLEKVEAGPSRTGSKDLIAVTLEYRAPEGPEFPLKLELKAGAAGNGGEWVDTLNACMSKAASLEGI